MRKKIFSVLCICCWIVPAFAQKLEFRAEQRYMFVNTEYAFVLTIPNAEANSVSADALMALPAGVHFVASSKMPLLQNGTESTQIRVVLSFSTAGRYVLPSVHIRHKRHTLTAQFAPIDVYINPMDLQPQLLVRLHNAQSGSDITNTASIPAGTKIRMRCSVQYAAQVQDIGWTLPENALFSEIVQTQISNSQFSPQAQQVAEFLWQPLTEGVHTLPDIYMTATAYNGTQAQLYTPHATVHIAPSERTELTETTQSLFAYAFAEETHTEPTVRIMRLPHSELQHRAAEYMQKLSPVQKILRRIGCGPRIALFAGGSVRAVPEEKAATTVQLQGGTELRIMQKAGKWVYIKSGAVAGWVKETDIYVIQ